MGKKEIPVKRKVAMSIVDLIRHKIFYGHIVQQMLRLHVSGEKASISTMAVGKASNELLVKLYVNDDFIEGIYDKYDKEEEAKRRVTGVLEHEVLHIILGHLELKFTDKKRGAVAVDLAVNSYMKKDDLPDGAVYPEAFGLEERQSAMWYYTRLQTNEKFDRWQNGKGEEKYENGAGSHEMWEEAAQDPIFKEMCRDMIRKAKDSCPSKDYGDIPSEIMEQIEDFLGRKKSIVPWNRILRLFAASAMESDLNYTVKRLSKRFGTRPGTKKDDILNLAVAVDTSGSISSYQLGIFFNEIKWIWKNGAMVTVYEADADVQRVYKFKGKFDGEAHGRGGTDLEPVMKEVEGKYDAVVYFTDFYAPALTRRYYIPTLWLLTEEMNEEYYPAKWGKHVVMNTLENEYEN